MPLFEQRDGWRYEAFVTNTTAGQLAFLEARHRAHARVEDRIRHTKDSGLGRFPSLEFNINQTWLMITQIAADLTARTRLLGCVGDAATLATCEPKAVRYRFPPRARPTRSQRTPTSPQDPGVTALGNRDRRGLREHRRHPATGPTWPARPRHHHPENRSPAAPAGPSSYPQSLHTRAHSTTRLRHDPDRRHERPGLSASAWSPRQGQTEELPGSQPLPRSPLNSDPTSPLRGLLQSQPQDRRAARGQQVPRRRSASRGSGRELSLPTRGTRRGPESCNPCIS
ncbi:MAG: transposase [Kocuria rhizophila]|nr:transposase [Kocuria rhizophila]